MTDYIIYNNDYVIMRVSCTEADAQTMATDNSASFVLDTFSSYELDQLQVVSGSISVKPQGVQDEELEIKQWTSIRAQRDGLLSSSDWTQFNDSPLTDTKKQAWATYRQALRDLPANTTDPRNPTWPTKPS